MDALPASLVSRSLVLVDHLAASVIGLVIGFPLGLVAPAPWVLVAAPTVLLTNLLYFAYFEGRDGQTPVKRKFGLVVVTKDGDSIGYVDAAIRNTVRLLEFPTIYLLGIGLAIATPHNQRLGDIAASTVVIEPEEYDGSYRIKEENVSDQTRIIGYLLSGIGVLPLAGLVLHALQAI